ncbi:MAG: hypothetical protein U0941_24925 [Planctomycetaceae bacterium]
MPSPIGSDAAAKQFLEMLIEAEVTSETPDFVKAWQVFQTFCEVPIRCSGEGFMFEAHYENQLIDGAWTHDRSTFVTRLTRYWYKPGKISATTYLAEANWKFVADTRIPESASKVSIQTGTLTAFRHETGTLAELIQWINQARVKSFRVYAGKR